MEPMAARLPFDFVRERSNFHEASCLCMQDRGINFFEPLLALSGACEREQHAVEFSLASYMPVEKVDDDVLPFAAVSGRWFVGPRVSVC